MKVTLSREQILQAAYIGVKRHTSSLEKRLKPAHGYDNQNPWEIHIEGACGELAASLVLHKEWDATVDTFKKPDLGPLQIRTTKSSYLIVRDSDADDEVFVLVMGSAPCYNVAGWMVGRDAKKDRWRRSPNGRPPAYFVPNWNLNPLASLADYFDKLVSDYRTKEISWKGKSIMP